MPVSVYPTMAYGVWAVQSWDDYAAMVYNAASGPNGATTLAVERLLRTVGTGDYHRTEQVELFRRLLMAARMCRTVNVEVTHQVAPPVPLQLNLYTLTEEQLFNMTEAQLRGMTP